MHLYSFKNINTTLNSYTQEITYSTLYKRTTVFKKAILSFNSRFQVNKLYILLFIFIFLKSYFINNKYYL